MGRSCEGLRAKEPMLSHVSVIEHLHKKLSPIMEITSKVSYTSEESTAKTRVVRGKSLKACVAKAAGWTLEKAKDVTLPKIRENKMI